MIVVGVEEDEVSREVGIHELEGEGRSEGCKERTPHHLVRKVVGHLGGGGPYMTRNVANDKQESIIVLCYSPQKHIVFFLTVYKMVIIVKAFSL